MAKYSELDPQFLRRYFDLLSAHGRGVDKKYSNNRCGKEMFVARTMRKWLKNKCFVVIQKDPTGAYATTNQNDPNAYYEVRIPKKHYVQITGCNYQLGYNEKLDIYVDDVFSSKAFNDTGFSYNDFLRLQFREITVEEFDSVRSLFVDDRDDNEYEMIAFTKKYVGKGKNKKLEEIKVKAMGKDYREARETAVTQYPDYVIYG
jgi:hypothetical protein